MRHALLVIFLYLSFADTVNAAEQRLRFREAGSDVREREILEMLFQSGLQEDLPFSVAGHDLNHDGVDEYIIRQDGASNCRAQASCRFFLAGLSEREPVLLSVITAGEIGILDDTLYGIDQLAIYSDPNDDFSYERYRWNAQKSDFSRF